VIFPIISGLMCLTGCIQSEFRDGQPALQVDESKTAEPLPSLEIDFRSEVTRDLFHTWGSLKIDGYTTLPYLMLNATLLNHGLRSMSTKYVMTQIEPGKSYAFDISENVRINPGDYRCVLEISGQNGVISSETRECLIAGDQVGASTGVQTKQVTAAQKQSVGVLGPATMAYPHDKPSADLINAQGSERAGVPADERESVSSGGQNSASLVSQGNVSLDGKVSTSLDDQENVSFDGQNNVSLDNQDNVSLDKENISLDSQDNFSLDDQESASLHNQDSISLDYQDSVSLDGQNAVSSNEIASSSAAPDSSGVSAYGTNPVDINDHSATVQHGSDGPVVQKAVSDIGSGSLETSGDVEPESYQGVLIGTKSTKKYHRPDCRYALKIKPENRVIFSSPDEARAQGYQPCKVCNPP